MELRELKTFRTTAHTLNFTQAAHLLGYAQSSITAQIQALEVELGVLLFNRLGRRVILTEEGQRLLWYAEKILALEAEACNVIAGKQELNTTLIIGAPETVCTYRLPAVVEAFRQTMPNVRIILKALFYTDIQRQLKDGSLDLAFLIEDHIVSHHLHVETLLPEPVSMVTLPQHPLVKANKVCPADLENETLLFTERGCGYRNKFERLLNVAGVHPTMIMEFGSVETIKQCVRSGLGIAVLPQMAVENQVQAGVLAALNWSEPFEVYTHIIWHKDKWFSPCMTTFLELTRTLLREA